MFDSLISDKIMETKNDLKIERDLLHAKYNVERRTKDAMWLLASLSSTEGMTVEEISESENLEFVNKIWREIYDYTDQTIKSEIVEVIED